MKLIDWIKLDKDERKSRKKFNKWLTKKRKQYKKFFKNWGPWDTFYLYEPIKIILRDMYEYYVNGDCVMGIPVIIDDEGNIVQKDDRAETLKTALDLIQKYEELDDNVDLILDHGDLNIAWEEAHKALIEAFVYIADNMEKWWD